MFQGHLPASDGHNQAGEKLHQLYHTHTQLLKNMLAGMCIPDPFFRERLATCVHTLMKCLRDPALPLYELTVSD